MIRYQPTYRVGTIRHEGKTNVGVRGPAGPGLEFTWSGTSLGVREQGQEAFQYVNLLGPEGKTGPQGAPGKSLEFTWDGTSLGVRVEGQSSYQYVNLRGEAGQNGARGDNGADGKSLEFSWSGTALGVRVAGQSAYQYVDLMGPKGEAFTYEDFTPEQLLALVGAPGVGIQDIQRTNGNGAQGTTDTYTVTLTDGSSYTYQVYNGKDGEGAGDMTAVVYDPQEKKQDIFAYVDRKIEEIDVDVTADEVTFSDGETFQQKYDAGKLTGPAGGTGADGKSLEFTWDGTSLGVRVEGQSSFQYVDLEGQPGPTGPAGAPGYTPQRGTDYWTPADQAEIVEKAVEALTSAVRLTALPSSGTTLTANAEYRVAATVGTYQFNFPASGDVYVRFTTAGTFAISFASGTTYLGAVPKFEAGKTYELMARDKCVAAAEVVSA